MNIFRLQLPPLTHLSYILNSLALAYIPHHSVFTLGKLLVGIVPRSVNKFWRAFVTTSNDQSCKFPPAQAGIKRSCLEKRSPAENDVVQQKGSISHYKFGITQGGARVRVRVSKLNRTHAASYALCVEQEQRWRWSISLTLSLSAQLKWLRSVINFAKHKKCGCSVILSLGFRLLLAHINSGWTSFGRFLPLDTAADTPPAPLVWCINYARAAREMKSMRIIRPGVIPLTTETIFWVKTLKRIKIFGFYYLNH